MDHAPDDLGERENSGKDVAADTTPFQWRLYRTGAFAVKPICLPHCSRLAHLTGFLRRDARGLDVIQRHFRLAKDTDAIFDEIQFVFGIKREAEDGILFGPREIDAAQRASLETLLSGE